MDGNILLLSSNQDFLKEIISTISEKTYNSTYCKSFNEATTELCNNKYNLLITDYDVWDDELSFKELRNAYSDLDIIIVTKNSSSQYRKLIVSQNITENIVFYKDLYIISKMIDNILTHQQGKNMAKKELQNEYSFNSKNAAFNKMLNYCEKVADSNVNVLLIGESGSGKEIAAKYIHACSNRSHQPFVAVNCSAYTDTLLESELFGHEQGAFTGAIKSRNGKFETANKGSLFLDEIGDISLTIQVKLLRTIETKKTERIGSDISKYIDFRLITATNKDLSKEIQANQFREDFFYRISTIVIKTPALRERPEDLKSMINFFLEKSQKANNKKITYIEPEVQNFLYSYDYPGNIRELKNIIDRMVVFSVNGVITKDGLPVMYSIKKEQDQKTSSAFDEIIPFQEFKKNSEIEYLKWVFEKVNWNVAEAARQLNISTRQLFNKINEYNLKNNS